LPHYCGPIRVGRFPQTSEQDVTVWRCEGCGVGYLPDAFEGYEDDRYREAVNGGAEVGAYRATHDSLLSFDFSLVGGDRIRDRVVADVGCGGGSFLDFSSGVAKTTIGVEPSTVYREALAGKGHQVFDYSKNALPEWESKVDLAVSLAVIEHVDDPVEFLSDIRKLLKPESGRVLVSTPNHNDWLLEFMPDDYAAFFYRHVHRWYFDAHALRAAADAAGFSEVGVFHRQRFGMSNALCWARSKKPTGNDAFPLFSDIDAGYKAYLEQSGRADYLYAWLTP